MRMPFPGHRTDALKLSEESCRLFSVWPSPPLLPSPVCSVSWGPGPVDCLAELSCSCGCWLAWAAGGLGGRREACLTALTPDAAPVGPPPGHISVSVTSQAGGGWSSLLWPVLGVSAWLTDCLKSPSSRSLHNPSRACCLSDTVPVSPNKWCNS